MVPVAAPAPTAKGSALIGRKLQRYFPDCSPSWVTGTIIAYNATSGEHQVRRGKTMWLGSGIRSGCGCGCGCAYRGSEQGAVAEARGASRQDRAAVRLSGTAVVGL